MALIISKTLREEPKEKPPTLELTPVCRVSKIDSPQHKAPPKQEARARPRIHNTNQNTNIPFKKYLATVYDRGYHPPNNIVLPLGAIFDTTLSRAQGQANALHPCTGSQYIEVLEAMDPYVS